MEKIFLVNFHEGILSGNKGKWMFRINPLSRRQWTRWISIHLLGLQVGLTYGKLNYPMGVLFDFFVLAESFTNYENQTNRSKKTES